MDKEFHFDIIYLTFRVFGFTQNDSYITAYSSQYVDDNNRQYEVYLKKRNKTYTNKITQTFDMRKNANELEEMYSAFHFLPTMKYIKNRRDNISSQYITTPHNKLSQSLLNKALKSKNLYLIGITLHAFADTWAHQNFSGKFEKANCSISSGLLNGSVGHLEFWEKPDKIGEKWLDNRLLNEKICNNSRFIDALKTICTYLKEILKKEPKISTEEYLDEIYKIWQLNIEDRKKEYTRLLQKLYRGELIPMYNSEDWFEKSVQIIDKKYFAKHNFIKNHWYKFQKATENYLKGYTLEITKFNADFNQ